MKINGHLDLFSGIGGFSLALKRSGVEPSWIGFSDIDKYANQVFKRRFKDAEELGDITNVQGEGLPKDIDLLTGGFPCQSFSIAGKRGSFDDTRGTLFYEIIRILRYYISIKKPIPYIVLENVKGLYSAGNHTAFPTIYGLLSDIGYSVECELLNSKYFGVPQNRERIYFVGRHSSAGGRPKVFPIRQGNSKIKKTREKCNYTPKNIRTITTAHAHGTSTNMSYIKTQISNSSPREFGWRDESPTLCARDYKDPKWVKVHSTQTRSADRPSLTRKCDCDSGKLYQKCCGAGGGSGHLSKEDGTTYCLDSGNTQAVELNQIGVIGKDSEATRVYDTSCARTIKDGGGMGSKTGLYEVKVLTEARTDEAKKIRKENMKNGKDYSPRRMKELVKRKDNVTNTITSAQSKEQYVEIKSKVRRLTPTECERLQGFPDNWTDGQSDTQRYKQCGNAITVNVAEYIFRKLYEIRR